MPEDYEQTNKQNLTSETLQASEGMSLLSQQLRD